MRFHRVYRKSESNGRALPRIAVYLNFTTMLLDDLPGNGQAQAHALGLFAVKRFKQ
jgi:hypothetical protein